MMIYNGYMSEATIYHNLNIAYDNIGLAIADAKRAALEYEVYMSDFQHGAGQGIVVENVDDYFSNLLKSHEENNHE